jgi:hypothetical protein
MQVSANCDCTTPEVDGAIVCQHLNRQRNVSIRIDSAMSASELTAQCQYAIGPRIRFVANNGGGNPAAAKNR